jgi:hypothetical protein
VLHLDVSKVNRDIAHRMRTGSGRGREGFPRAVWWHRQCLAARALRGRAGGSLRAWAWAWSTVRTRNGVQHGCPDDAGVHLDVCYVEYVLFFITLSMIIFGNMYEHHIKSKNLNLYEHVLGQLI